MAKTLAELRKSRGSVADLQKEVEKLASKGFEKDTRFWQPTADKAGTGAAVIRFLPAPKGEDFPWVRLWNHGFQGPTGKWYMENSLTTLGQDDPVSQYNSEKWNEGDAGKEIARKQKRKLTYISNILVVTDPARPENDGKVFLYKYGKKIFDKIKDAMNPPKEFADEQEINPFDFWEGADFKLKFRKADGFRNYDKSAFMEQSPISESDAQIEEIWASQYGLAEFIDPKNFKTYDELKKKLDFVLGGGSVGTSTSSRKPLVTEDEDDDDVLPPRKPAPARKPVVEEDDDEDEAPRKPAKRAPVVEDDDDEDEAPAPKKAATKRAVVVEDDDDEDEAPAPKKAAVKAKRAPVVEDEEEEEEAPRKPAKAKRAPVVEEEEEEEPAPKKGGSKRKPAKDPVEEEDSTMSYFEKLAEED